MRMVGLFAVICCLALPVMANDKLVRLHAPDALVATGLMKHILPRFSLKTQVRVELVATPAEADAVFGAEGRAMFDGLGETWHIALQNADHKGTQRFADWLDSDVGRRTVLGFAPEGAVIFSEPSKRTVVVAEVSISGDTQLGETIARAKCGRCHAVDEAGRKNDIGSTPSFFVLRSLADWQARFESFYVLNPHPAFTQIAEVTLPFPPDRPSPIVPVEMTLDEVEAMLAFVAEMPAADLGAPLKHQ